MVMKYIKMFLFVVAQLVAVLITVVAFNFTEFGVSLMNHPGLIMGAPLAFLFAEFSAIILLLSMHHHDDECLHTHIEAHKDELKEKVEDLKEDVKETIDKVKDAIDGESKSED